MNLDYNNELANIEKLGAKMVDGFSILSRDIEIYMTLLKYFHHDPEFESLHATYKLKKGLLIRGPVGTGKTTIMKVFSQYNKEIKNGKHFQIRRSTTLNLEFIKDGPEMIEKNSINCFLKTEGIIDKKKPVTVCFDDLGTEVQESSFYSNHLNFMQFILQGRYDAFCDYGMKTYITSNLHPEDIERKYGYNVKSRLKEMCNDIVYNGNDRRQ